MSKVYDRTRIYAVKVTVGQEENVAEMLSNKIEALGLPYSKGIKAIVHSPDLKGYILVEATDPVLIDEVIQGVRHARGRVKSKYSYQPDFIPVEEALSYLKAKPSIELLSEGDMIEITGGPFKGMKARIISVNKDRGEVTVELLDTPYTMPITMYAEYVRKVSEKSG